jgi:hypothetical protein
MRRRIGLWSRVGFIVAGVWVILSFAIPLSPQPVSCGLVRLTCPIVPISFAFHFRRRVVLVYCFRRRRVCSDWSHG